MHPSAFRIGGEFLNTYCRKDFGKILEIGSLNVNGTIRNFAPSGYEWLGVDLVDGQSVDLVIKDNSNLPFDDNEFDVVIATSVLEHDSQFWETIKEMARVVKVDGFIYINAPSNGWVHRYPIDAFRFYPDAGLSFLALIKILKPDATLVESFISKQDNDIWNDFVAVFSMSQLDSKARLYKKCDYSNLWLEGQFIESSFLEIPEDFLICRIESHAPLYSELELIKESHAHLYTELELIKTGLSWKITRPLRKIKNILIKLRKSKS
jgi:SAM-dependent methyltransferase